MKHGVGHHSTPPIARITAVGTLMASIALVIACMGCSAIDDASVRDGALRGWYLPLGLFLVVLRARARRDTRRALSLALVILGVGALAARAVDARSDRSVPGASAALSEY